ncbi:unnamed protein product [Acidocella sp. C78]|nr:unnamed protein product [Acidocella sp. C78]
MLLSWEKVPQSSAKTTASMNKRTGSPVPRRSADSGFFCLSY